MSRDANKKDEYNTLAKKVKAIQDATAEAVKYADEHGLYFHFPAPAYGMGGYYYGVGHEDRSEDEYGNSGEEGWAASSQSC